MSANQDCMNQNGNVMNSMGKRMQSVGEEISNAISHGVGALLAIAGTIILIIKCAVYGSTISVVSASIYGASLIILYTVSTLYHSLTVPIGKKVFRVLDHCSIFILILGTYTPVALVAIGGKTGWILFGINAVLAAMGIVFNAVDLHKWRKVSMVLYVLMGWLVVFVAKEVMQVMPTGGLVLLLSGGIAYTLGIVFYGMTKKRYMHFVWHLFVLAGSILHYFCVLIYCV